MTPRRRAYLFWITLAVLMAMGFMVLDAWAAESFQHTLARWFDGIKTGFTRATWDTIMRWVNFLLLAALIYKYAKTPLALFLRDKKAETALSIEMLETKRHEAEAKIKESQILLQSSQERLALIKERIVSEGQRHKALIIEQARQESRRLMEGANIKIDSQVREAYNAVRLELIDMAVERAAHKLPQVITDKDQHHLIRLWMDAAR